MKKTPIRSIQFVISLLLLAGALDIQAANVTKLDTTTMNGGAADWSAVPATTDVGEFGATPTLAHMAAMTLGASITLGGLQLDGTMNGPLTISSANTLTLGTSGINMTAANQNATLNCTFTPAGSQTWNVQSGRTLTFGSGMTASGSTTYNLTLNNGYTGNVTLGSFTENYTSDGFYMALLGGNVTFGAITTARTASYTTAPTATAPISATTTSGIYVNGATVSATTITIGVGTKANSSSSMLVASGSLTASGAVVIGKNIGSSRWNLCQVSGGTFTVNDTATGLQLSPNNGVSNNAEFYVSGGTATVGKISFGASGDTLGGIGWVIVKGSGNLYIGSGGIALVGGGIYPANISLYSGLLGASATWSSSLAMQLSGPVGSPFTIQAADSGATPHDIALSGVISGVGSLTKTGGGKLTLSGANSYVGTTAINAGTVNAGVVDNGTTGPLGKPTTAVGSITFGGGTLQYSGANNTDYSGRFSTAGSQSVSIDTAGRSVSFATAIVGSATTLTLTDTAGTPGSLTLGATGNSYTGATTVNGGTLLVNGTITGKGAVAVNSGGTLSGSGSLSGAVAVNSGGMLSPGNSGVGTLTVNSLNLATSTCTNNFEFSSVSSYDQISVGSGGLTVSGGKFNLYQPSGTLAYTVPGTYSIITYSGTDPSLDSTWTTVSSSNPHIANPQLGYQYSFAASGGVLGLTISSTVNSGTWSGSSGANWSVS